MVMSGCDLDFVNYMIYFVNFWFCLWFCAICLPFLRTHTSGSSPNNLEISHGGKLVGSRPASSGTASVMDSSQWQPHPQHTSTLVTSTTANRMHNLPRIPIKDQNTIASDQSNPRYVDINMIFPVCAIISYFSICSLGPVLYINHKLLDW